MEGIIFGRHYLMKYNTKRTSDKPYYYKGHIRIFSNNLTFNDLKWHRDKGNRFIYVLSGNNWYLQFDNHLPILLMPKKYYKIPSAVYHRVINKSNDGLKIKIVEF